MGWLPLTLTVILLGVPAVLGIVARRSSSGRRGPGLGLRKD